MGRWYAELQKIAKTPEIGTDKTDKTPPDRLLSVLSVPVLGKSEIFQDRQNSFVSFVSSASEQKQNFSDGDDDLQMLFEERAAIMEFDGDMSRADAEASAWADVIGNRARAA